MADKTAKNENEDITLEEISDEGENPEENLSEEIPEEIKKIVQTESARKRHWREKYQKTAEELKKVQAEVETLKRALITSKVSKEEFSSQEDEWKKKMEFIVKHRNLEPAEIDEVVAYAKGKGIGYEEALRSSFVKAALEAIREKKKSTEASPESSFKSPVYKKYTQDELSKMSSKELEKILPKKE